MSKPYTKEDLSSIFDTDLTWRRKELSDLKSAINVADALSQQVLLKAIITMGYAHWEGYVKTCAMAFFEYLTLRRKSYVEFERQIYVNSMLPRIDSLHRGRVSVADRCKIINDILDGQKGRFSYLNPGLVDTCSNLNTDVLKDICLICSVDPRCFENKKVFIDVLLLKRRNAIAHGQQEYITTSEIDSFVADVLSLMENFRALLENKIYTQSYSA